MTEMAPGGVFATRGRGAERLPENRPLGNWVAPPFEGSTRAR